MNPQSLTDLIIAGWRPEAATLASSRSVSALDSELSYDFIDEHAEEVSDFLQGWVPTLPPFARLQAAEWAAGQYVTALVHLDHAYGLAATLLLGAQEAATRALAESFRGVGMLADGPDAELDPAVVGQLSARADSLDAIDFPWNS